MRSTLILGFSFAAVALLATVAGAAKVSAAVKVQKTTFRGWHGAYRISNGVVEAVVVPQIGRIMLFQWVNQPDSNPIFINKDLLGKTAADAPAGEWANFGGDKLWPAPQSDWPKHDPSAWPPDRAFDGSPFEVEVLPDGVRLIGPWSAGFAARAVRTITMRSGEPRLYIAQEIQKSKDAAGDKDAFPIAVWNVTQTRGDGTFFLPIPSKSTASDPGYRMLGGSIPLPGNWKIVGDMLAGDRDPKTSMKVGSSATDEWLASLYAADIVFSEHYRYQPGANYPDSGSTAEVYTNGGDLAYIEMEVMAPLVPLAAGQTQKYDVYWQLSRLPRRPKDTVDAARLIHAAMR